MMTARYCHSVALEFEHSDILGLYQRYNTITKTAILLEVEKQLYRNDKNRLVWEVFFLVPTLCVGTHTQPHKIMTI
jgi:hypothetical protein